MTTTVSILLALLGTAALAFLLGWLLGGSLLRRLRQDNRILAVELDKAKARLQETLQQLKDTREALENLQLARADQEKTNFELAGKLKDLNEQLLELLEEKKQWESEKRRSRKGRSGQSQAPSSPKATTAAPRKKTKPEALEVREEQPAGGIRPAPVVSSLFRAWLHNENLKLIEGLGGEDLERLRSEKIEDLAALAECSLSRLREIFPDEDKHSQALLESWPDQAILLRRRQWGELLRVQRQVLRTLNPDAPPKPTRIENLFSHLIASPFMPRKLQLVSGISPKVEKILFQNGIKELKDLARADGVILRSILSSGGERFKALDPSTWPHQAKLALEGRWGALLDFQRKALGSDFDEENPAPTKLERFFEKIADSPQPCDDFKIILGVDSRIEQGLFAAGIRTWQQLAGAQPEALRKVLAQAGIEPAPPSLPTWPQQAALILAGKWEELDLLRNRQLTKAPKN